MSSTTGINTDDACGLAGSRSGNSTVALYSFKMGRLDRMAEASPPKTGDGQKL
jgi:hypothetical protein